VTPYACVWDGTGCFDDGCNPDQRQTNCAKFEQESSCKSDTGADNRCTWSAIEVVAAEVEVASNAYGNGCGYGNPDPCPDPIDQVAIQSDASSSGICVWDGTGCFDDGCDVDQRHSNCAKFEMEDSCKSELGADNRCMWSVGGSAASFAAEESLLFGVIDLGFIGSFNPMEMTWDLVVVAAALFVFMAWVGFNIVRWCQRPPKFEYEPVYEVEMHGV